MKRLALTILTAFTFLISYGQSPENVAKNIPKNPILFIDGVQIQKSELQKIDEKQVASVTVYNDSISLAKYEDMNDAVIYIETKDFSKKRFLNYFKSKSTEFEQLLTSQGNDSSFQYILNGRVLKDNYEGNLASIHDKIFKSLRIINRDELGTKYEVSNKEYGILITSDVPENLYNGEKKF